MRTTRSSRIKKQKRQRWQKRHMNTCKIASLLAITTFGAGQLVPSSYALSMSEQQTEISASAAFVFPGTVKQMADEAGQAAERADGYSQRAYAELEKCRNAGSSAAAYALVGSIAQLVVSANEEKTTASNIVSQLETYVQRAQKDVDTAKDVMKGIQKELLEKQDGQPTEGLLREVQLLLVNSQDMNAGVKAAENWLKDVQPQDVTEQDKDIEQKVKELLEQYKLLFTAGFTGEAQLKFWWQPAEAQNEILTKVKSAQEHIRSVETVFAYITTGLDAAKDTPQKIENSAKSIEAAGSMASDSARAIAQAEERAAAAARQGAPQGGGGGGGGSSSNTPAGPPHGGGSNNETSPAPSQNNGDVGKDAPANSPQENGGGPGKEASAPSQGSGSPSTEGRGGDSDGGSSSSEGGGSNSGGGSSSSEGGGGNSGGGSSSSESGGGNSDGGSSSSEGGGGNSGGGSSSSEGGGGNSDGGSDGGSSSGSDNGS